MLYIYLAGKCDEVMSRVMEKLSIPIPKYSRETDPIFGLATPLHSSEILSKSSRELNFPENESFPNKLVDINNYIQFDPQFKVPLPITPTTSTSDNDNESENEEEEEAESETVSNKTPETREPGDTQTSASSTTNNTPTPTPNKTKSNKKVMKVDGRTKSSKLLIKKGNGNGWLGNAWGVKPKSKQRKLK